MVCTDYLSIKEFRNSSITTGLNLLKYNLFESPKIKGYGYKI